MESMCAVGCFWTDLATTNPEVVMGEPPSAFKEKAGCQKTSERISISDPFRQISCCFAMLYIMLYKVMYMYVCIVWYIYMSIYDCINMCISASCLGYYWSGRCTRRS